VDDRSADGQKPFILRDGRALVNWVRPQHFYRPNPRTAMGLSADRRTLVIVAADGRRPVSPGSRGSSWCRCSANSMWRMPSTSTAAIDRTRDETVISPIKPSDGPERIVVSHLRHSNPHR